jgi:hypothetical protein
LAKRFTDTDKWKDPWFDNLSPIGKAFFYYLIDHVDCAGIWKPNFRHFERNFGFKYTEEEFKKDFSEKVTLLDNGNFFYNGFIDFQYGSLRDNNSAHMGVYKVLKHNGVDIELKEGYSDSPRAILSRLSSKKKRELMAKDYFACTYCSMRGDEYTLTIDHIVPRSKGGDNHEYNLTTACVSCNSKKTDLDADFFIEKFNYENNISEKLRSKLAVIKKLNGAFSGLIGAKDKDTDKDKDKDKDNINTSSAQKIEDDFHVPDKIMRVLTMQYLYPENIITEIARDAWLIYISNKDPKKDWDRFIAHYFKNERDKIREKAIEIQKAKSLSEHAKELFNGWSEEDV